MERKYFKIYVRIIDENEVFLVSDGSIVLENEVFEGYITDDYITGTFKEQTLFIQMLIYDYGDQISDYVEFKDEVDFFEIPETYIINGSESTSTLEASTLTSSEYL